MVWADRIVGEIKERFHEKIARGETLVLRDEKTLSGRVHVGSLRGIVLHGLIQQVLQSMEIAAVFRFELNEMDPMDELPKNLVRRDEYKRFMGQPLYTVPAHEEGAENYPMVYGREVQGVIARLGLTLEYYKLQPAYAAGEFDDVIRDALNHAKEIRAIYKEVSGSEKPEDWYPLQVICESCGKVGTTQVTAWDEKSACVQYICKPDLVTWAQGCGHSGEISPFNGKAKLPWKVEWPAKWKVFGVDIEGAGKDHSTSGGSREIGKRIVEEIFHYPEPFDIPYEFFNIGGKKMSASKGLGASAKEVSDLLPPTLLRLLMLRKLPNQPIDFDPEGTTIPNLFDEYDRLADHYFKRHKEPDADFARSFALCQLCFPTPPKDLWQMRFSLLSFVVQMPHLSLHDEAAKLKGSPLSKEETLALDERAHYVRQWLSLCAPPEARYTILKEVPADLALNATQRSALESTQKCLADPALAWKGAAIHTALHAVKTAMHLEPPDLFQPLYMLFLGRQSGPQMGWFLSTFPREEALQRISSALSKNMSMS
jgi:lysyl-tRNA synthetase class 1